MFRNRFCSNRQCGGTVRVAPGRGSGGSASTHVTTFPSLDVSRARPVREVQNPTAICEPTAYTMLDPQHRTTLYASMACYGDSFTFLYADDVRTSQETYL
jgi:hypothetical protein